MLLYNSSLVLCFHIAIVVIVVVLCFVLFFHPFTVSLFSSGYCWRNDSNNVAASFVPTTIHNRDRATWERRCRREKKLLLILLCITCLLLFLLSLFIFFFFFFHPYCVPVACVAHFISYFSTFNLGCTMRCKYFNNFMCFMLVLLLFHCCWCCCICGIDCFCKITIYMPVYFILYFICHGFFMFSYVLLHVCVVFKR